MAWDLVLVDLEEVDTFESELDGPLAELVDRELFVAPAAYGLMDAAGCRHFLLRGQGERGGDGRDGSGLDECAT